MTTRANGAVQHKGRVTKVIPIDPAKLSTDDVVAAILLSRCDPDLERVLAACFQRVKASGADTEWQFEFRGMKLQKRDFSFGDMRKAQKIAGKFWTHFNAIHDADSQAALLAVALHKQLGISLEMAEAELDKAEPDEIDRAFSVVIAAPPEQPPFDGTPTP